MIMNYLVHLLIIPVHNSHFFFFWSVIIGWYSTSLIIPMVCVYIDLLTEICNLKLNTGSKWINTEVQLGRENIHKFAVAFWRESDCIKPNTILSIAGIQPNLHYVATQHLLTTPWTSLLVTQSYYCNKNYY